MKRALMIFALVTSIAAVVGIGATLDGRYAKAAVVSQVSERLEQKIIQDRMDRIQERLWNIEDREAERFVIKFNRIHDTLAELINFFTPETRDQWRRLEKEYAELEDKLTKE